MSSYCFEHFQKWKTSGLLIYPHNSYLFFVIPQVYVAADKNESYDHVLLWNIYLLVFSGGLLRSHANKAVSDRQTKFVNKPFITDLTIYLQIVPDR